MSGKRAVENVDLESLLPEVGTEVKDPQRNIGLHDLEFLRILPHKVSVSE
jgi:hypothetical protein